MIRVVLSCIAAVWLSAAGGGSTPPSARTQEASPGLASDGRRDAQEAAPQPAPDQTRPAEKAETAGKPPAGEAQKDKARSERSSKQKTSGWIELPTKDWRAGPVRYILTRNEEKAFKKLKTDVERAAFIERFWARRDPSPDTTFNEYRAQFHSRVASADQLFRDSPVPGWRSDRGKIYILLGPPDDMVQDTMAREHRGTILWTYRHTARADLGPEMIVPFARDATGEYILTVRPSEVADPTLGLAPNTPNFGIEAWLYGRDPRNNPYSSQYRPPGGIDPLLRSRGVFSGSSDLSLLGDLTKLQLPDYEVLNEQVVTRTFYGRVPLDVRVDYFKATEERTFLTLTLGVRSSSLQFRRGAGGDDVPDVAISTRIVSDANPQTTFSLESPRHFIPSPRNAGARYDQELLWQARIALEPGLYKADFVLEDRVRGSVATHQSNLEVPDFYDPGLQMSSVILSDRLDPAPEGSDPGRTPFVFGRWLLVPNLAPDLDPSREISLYFQVYNARRDPVTHLPLLDVSYRFYALHQGRFEPLSEAVVLTGQTSEVHAYAVPLRTFPPGSYMVRTEVRDALAGASTFRETLFRIGEGAK